MEALIQDLTLTYAIKNNAIPILKEQKDVIEIVRRTVVESINHSPESGKQLSFQTNCKSYNIAIDEKWLVRILQNLIMNAIIHNPPHTNIEVGVMGNNEKLEIYVKDNGVGMKEEAIPQLFTKYFRGTNTDASLHMELD
ncbi:sensor histidine kinase [Heyndrickxia oleronia]|uniref:sensor histidine kinase n=1 Tax=Heyndrickxia oleronia TaxID=38875 RepID=UPI0021B370BD|nr:sensor histidine kinase [Heyndrickxia oleronia]